MTNLDYQPLLDELHNNPFSKDVRLVLADILDESGDTERAEILRRGNIPLFAEDQAAAIALGNCNFAPATFDKKFARDIATRAKGYVECGTCYGRADGDVYRGRTNGVPCPDCKGTGRSDRIADLTPKMWLWLWVILHRYRRSVKDKAIRKLAESRYNRSVELLDVKHLKPLNRRLTVKAKERRDMRTTLFDE